MNKENRKTYLITLIVLAAFVLLLIGGAFAYFLATVTNNTTPVSVTTTQVANLTMTDVKSETGSIIYPGWVGFQGIDVAATGSGNAVYDLSLTIVAGTNIKNDIQVSICKVENDNNAIASGDFTFTAATPAVNTTGNTVGYYMTGGVVGLPGTCTSIVSNVTLSSLGNSYRISAGGGKEIATNKHDKYYITYTYLNRETAQVAGETFTITPSLSAKAEQTGTISCVDGSGNAMACDFSAPGQRVAIAKSGQPTQYFRYIRTTDNGVTSLNECGTDSSTACTDTANNGTVGIPGQGYLRLLAEYNLNVGSKQYPNGNTTDPINAGIQDEHVFGYKSGYTKYGNIAYSSSNSQYSSSNVKTNVEAYINTLTTTYGISGLSGSAITKAEIFNLCSLSNYGDCANTYPWVYNTSYWSGSASDSNYVWRVSSSGSVTTGYYDDGCGARAVVQILASSI